MTNICYPPGTDWACVYTSEQLAEMWSDPAVAAQMERAEALAWSTIATLSAWQVATCPITVRPCMASCAPPGIWQTSFDRGGSARALGNGARSGFDPHIDESGVWVNSCGHSRSDCSCTSICEVILPGPVGAIAEIKIDGAVLPVGTYRVDNGNRLVRTDGGCWPTCQDMSKSGNTPQYEPVVVENEQAVYTFTRDGEWVRVDMAPKGVGGFFRAPVPYSVHSMVQVEVDGAGWMTVHSASDQMSSPEEVNTIDLNGPPTTPPTTLFYQTDDPAAPNDSAGTFFVSYWRGVAPNSMLLYAAGVLATEFFKACRGDDCRLPSGVTSVSRMGISYTIASGLFEGGRTGIREVDAVIGIYNPYALTAPPVATSPDMRPARMTTWG